MRYEHIRLLMTKVMSHDAMLGTDEAPGGAVIATTFVEDVGGPNRVLFSWRAISKADHACARG